MTDDRQLIDPDKVSDPTLKILAYILNFLALIIFCVFTTWIIVGTRTNPGIAASQDAFMGNIVVAVTWSISAMLAATAAVDLFNPWFSFSELMKGDKDDKRTAAIIFVGVLIAVALVVKGIR
jgi:hypothetical protein